MKQKKLYRYETDCVHSTAKAIIDMVDQAREVTLATLERNCANLEDWKHQLGYSTVSFKGFMRLKDDYAVTYWKSKYRGKPCYYIKHSSIEYVWVKH